MTDQTTAAGPRAGLADPARKGSGPTPRDLAARAAARDATDARSAPAQAAPAQPATAQPAAAQPAPAQPAGGQPAKGQPAPGPAAAAQPAPAQPAGPAAPGQPTALQPTSGQPRERAHGGFTEAVGAQLTGAQALVGALERLGVDVVFGIPGGAILPLYDPLFDSVSVRHILVRHEQGAGHAAAGYAQVTGRPGVCMATSGPGATNLVTPLADAYMDSVPVVAITGQVPSALIGTDGFQEADISGITLPITKHNFLVTKADDIARTIAEAFHVASTGRPGPVLVDVAKDALQSMTEFHWPVAFDLPGYHPVTRPHSRQVREAARLIAEAERPVLYVGGGVIKSGASQELVALADLTGIPVVTTLMARGGFPDSHPQNLGMPGMHGTVAAVGALQKADLLITLGARFDDRVTGKLDSFARDAAIVHADIDPAEISKNRRADVPIVGDCREVITELLTAVTAEQQAGHKPDLTAWWSQLDAWRTTYPLGYDQPGDGSLAPQFVIERIGQIAGPDAVYVAGVGQHQMWAAQFIQHERPGHWLNSGGLGTMGYAVPAAMGAKVGRPDTCVWAIDGDGCFQMTNQELATCTVNGIPIKVAIINNGNLGMVRQWQTLFYNERYSNTDLDRRHGELATGLPATGVPSTGHPDPGLAVAGGELPTEPGGRPRGTRIPDFVKLAEAYGCVGLRCEDAASVDAVIEKAMAINDRPVVVDFIVHRDAMVWPMVAAGTSNDDIIFARNIAPDWDVSE
jgi:acetolactate synthase I/II/III large subunit